MHRLDRACPETWRSRAEELGWHERDLDAVARDARFLVPVVTADAIALWVYDGSRLVLPRWQPPRLEEHLRVQALRDRLPGHLVVARCLGDRRDLRDTWVGASECVPGRCGARVRVRLRGCDEARERAGKVAA